MKKRPLLFGLALCLVLLLAGCGLLQQPHSDKKAWTVMFYLDADEQAIQQDMIAAFTEMISQDAGSSADVNIVIQFDRWPTAEAFGGWDTTHRFYYLPGMEPTPEAAIQNWGDGRGGREVNMADPATLSSFIYWAANKYPAEHYALIPVGHGYGWQGLLIDMTSKGEFMSVKGPASALNSSWVKLDLLGLDACLMAMSEVVYELRNAPLEVVAASENSGTTWPLAGIIKAVTGNPAITAEALGRTINDLYYAYHPADPSITLSTIRVNKVGALSAAVKELAETMMASTTIAVVQAKAATVMSAIDAAVVYRVNGTDWPSAEGITIYWPKPNMGYMPDTFFYSYIGEIVAFADDAAWRDFLFIFFNPMSNPGVIPSKVYQTRNAMIGFDDDTKIDLYDFCRQLVNN